MNEQEFPQGSVPVAVAARVYCKASCKMFGD